MRILFRIRYKAIDASPFVGRVQGSNYSKVMVVIGLMSFAYLKKVGNLGAWFIFGCGREILTFEIKEYIQNGGEFVIHYIKRVDFEAVVNLIFRYVLTC